MRDFRISSHLKPFSPASYPGRSLRSRDLATFCCLRVKYLAVPGRSGIYRNTRNETIILGKPSTKNNNRQLAIGIRFPILVITQAKLLANDVASGAAEMKRLRAIRSQHCFFKFRMRYNRTHGGVKAPLAPSMCLAAQVSVRGAGGDSEVYEPGPKGQLVPSVEERQKERNPNECCLPYTKGCS